MFFQSCATKCKTCASLLADYKYSFKLFTDAVRHLPGLVGHDRALTHQKLEQLRLACRDRTGPDVSFRRGDRQCEADHHEQVRALTH